MTKSNISAALLSLDSEALKSLLDDITTDCDLTFGHVNGKRKVKITDRQNGIEIIACCPGWTEAMDYAIATWQDIRDCEPMPEFEAA